MTKLTDDKRQIYTEADIVHPWWCQGPGRGVNTWCDVRVTSNGKRVTGYHVEPARSMSTMYGHKVVIQRTCQHGAAYETSVALRIGLSDDEDDWPAIPDSLVLEPEEADLLARLLHEAAARWRADQARG